MTEPTTPNIGLIVPNTGDLPGAWGTSALNVNASALDGMLGGKATIALSSATTITLSVPSGSITPGAGPNQSQNALLKFTGTLSGNAVIKFTMPGKYIVDNRCAVGTSFAVQLAPATGTGNTIGAPPGRKCDVFFDGTDMDYVNVPDPGTAYDLHGATSLPAWMTACSVLPYLIKDGTSYSTSLYPALQAALNNAFGGSGGSFNVPDESNRMRLPFDTNASGRVTAGGSGIAGNTMGATGGNQLAQQHAHSGSGNVSDPGHTHTYINPAG